MLELEANKGAKEVWTFNEFENIKMDPK